MKKIFTFIFISLICIQVEAQQDPQYSLYQFNQMVINPAYAGARDGLSVIAANRQQWVGFSGAPKTTCLSLHGPVLRKNLGLGLTMVNDQMGPRDVTSIYGNIAYLLKITSDMRLSFGVNAGYNRYQFNNSKIKWENGETSSQLYSNQVDGALDINAGVYLKNKSFFLGISGSHLNNPSVYTYDAGKLSYKLRTHIFVTAGHSFILGKDAIFAPTTLIKLVEGEVSADINMNFFLYQKLWIGGFYRMGYGPGMLLQYYVTNRLRVGLAYDTGLQAARRLGHSFEAMIGFDFAGNKGKMVNPRFL